MIQQDVIDLQPETEREKTQRERSETLAGGACAAGHREFLRAGPL